MNLKYLVKIVAGSYYNISSSILSKILNSNMHMNSNFLSKIINSVIMAGLYYGFLTALALKTSYILLIRAMVRENPNHKAAAIMGLILGQLGRFLSIYYAPLYIAFGRPYTLTVLTLIYFLVNLFGNNLDKNAIRTLEIPFIFLNNLILQLLNTCIFPSSTLARVVNVYLFRCNNKMVFLISSFSAWLIGQILVLKCCQLVLGWGQNKNSIRALIQKYLVRNSMFFLVANCLFGSSLFILTIQSLGRIPLPIPTQKLSEISRIEKREEERLKKSGVAKEEKSTEDEEDLSHEKEILKKEPYSKLEDEDEEIEKDIEQAIGTLLFDHKRWTRPFRYIKNNQFEQSVKNEMSQYFFATQQSDGKARICFTHPVNLSIFWKGISFLVRDKNYSNMLNTRWVERNKQKLKFFKIDFFNQIQNLDKTLGSEFGITRTRLCIHNDETKQEYLPEEYDPLLTGAYRGRIKTEQGILPKKENETSTDPLIEILENNTNDQHVKANPIGNEKISFGEEIRKKVPRWSYKLITELEQISYYRNPPDDHDIRTRKAKSLVVFDPSKHPNMETMEDNMNIQNDSNNKTITKQNNLKNKKITTSQNDLDNDNNTTTKEPKDDKSYSIRYSHQSDFRHGLIKDSMRSLRRKIVIADLFKGNVHSPLFFERRTKKNWFSLSGLVKLKRLFITWSARKEFEVLENKKKNITTKDKKRQEAKERIEIAEAWDSFELTQALRGFLLITQSRLRKDIILPSFIIIKNIGRILLFQTSEWSEDFDELEKETHVPCTYNGIPLGEKEFPRNWLTEGIQIKILSPFCLKPWNQDKKHLPAASENFCFLTIWGQETDHIFGRPRKRPSFFKPILTELDKSFRKMNVVLFSKKKKRLDPSIMKEKTADHLSNDILNEPLNQFKFSQREKFHAITNRTSILKTKLEQITEERKKVMQELDMSFSKKILKRKKFKLIYNLSLFQYFLKFFIQKIYNILFVNNLLICRLINQKFEEAKQYLLDKSYSKKKNIRKVFNFIFNTKRQQKSTTFNNLSDLSQAYVLYKISQQTGIFNICKLRSILNLQRTSVFIKTQIKKSFATQGLIQTEGITPKIPQLRTHQWKNWLKVNSQYDLSQIIWSSFSAKKQRWLKKINRCRKFNKKSLDKWNSSRISNLNDSNKQNSNNLVLKKSEKYNFEKCYRYDVLSYNFINFEKKKTSFIDRSTISLTKRQQISYNKTMSQNFLFALTKNILVKNLIGKIERLEIPYIEKDLDRKYLSFENINFSLKKKVNIESWIPLTSRGNPIKTYNFQLLDEGELMEFIDQIFKKEKELIFPCIEQNNEISRSKSKHSLIDWMGLNKELLNHPVTNMDLWFFPEFVSLLNVYKLKPWILYSQLLLSKLTFSKLPSQQQNQTKTKKNGEPKSKTETEENKETENQQKDKTNTKQKSKTETEENKEIENQQNDETEEDPQLAYIRSFLKKHLLFQLRGDFIFKKSGFKNIQILCLLLRLMNQNEMLLSSIQRQKLNLHIMPEIGIKELTLEVLEDIGVPEFLKEKRVNFEPFPLFINKNGKFLMYQLINISLVHKIKYPKFKNQVIITTQKKNNVTSFIPENILSSRRRRELRILIFLNSNITKCKGTDTNSFVSKKKCKKFWEEQKNTIELLIWPSSRFEDLACMNRYWFYTNNGSRFSMLRILMYLPLKIY
uniref:Protein TIC 214 n=1 Tax=Cuscuta costaricensis TaxID=437255 RepID=A0A4Y5N1Y9_9ASTE|nr:Ycf1 protein [Cuscuta costaricensis]QCW07743.1 Ycf1 protein [Cuscuta costaricensis]